MLPVTACWLLLCILSVAAWSSPACDLCAIYAASQARGEVGNGCIAGFAEQFTHFGTLQRDGQEVPNPAGQFLDSSITQLLLGYNVTTTFGLQLNAPLLYRSFRRPEGFRLHEGAESGLGDLSLLANYQAYQHLTMRSTFTANLLGGVKFPTGSTRRLKEETVETEPLPGELRSGIHGHDLTLGTGSYDGMVGASLFGRWQRAFFSAAIQYAIRTPGDFEYEFANDLTWFAGPGSFLVLKDNYTLALQAVTAGETKGHDQFRNTTVEDTALTAVYLGPQLLASWRNKLSAQIALDLPVSLDNSALQIVPDYRLRAAFTWHF